MKDKVLQSAKALVAGVLAFLASFLTAVVADAVESRTWWVIVSGAILAGVLVYWTPWKPPRMRDSAD